MVPVEQLVEIPFFQGLSAETLRHFSDCAHELQLEPGDFITRQHDQARHVYFLLSGSAQILIRFEGIDDLMVGLIAETHALIGWSTFRIPYRYTASLRCEEPTRVVRLAREDFDVIFEKHPYTGFLLLQRVAAALANRLEQTRDILVRLPGQSERESAGV